MDAPARFAAPSPVDIAAAQRAHPLVFAKPLRERLGAWTAVSMFFAFTAYAVWAIGLDLSRVFEGIGKLGHVLMLMLPPTAKDAFWDYAYAMAQTVAMAFLGTLIAAILAVPLAMLCARNVIPASWLRFGFRRVSDTLRGVDQLIWALVFVRAVGLGPLAGVLAIIISDVGTLAKLFSEAIENADRKAVDGVRACGGGSLLAMRFGIVPQVLPIMISNTLYIFESNTRSATILGIVGAGGIGFFLSDRIRTMHWDEAAFILLMILVTVYLIDALSKRVRARLIGESATPAVH
jgi:phosphonate transport system permease protein